MYIIMTRTLCKIKVNWNQYEKDFQNFRKYVDPRVWLAITRWRLIVVAEAGCDSALDNIYPVHTSREPVPLTAKTGSLQLHLQSHSDGFSLTFEQSCLCLMDFGQIRCWIRFQLMHMDSNILLYDTMVWLSKFGFVFCFHRNSFINLSKYRVTFG